ncbi:hypothetical protein RLDS_01795 [Sphingobium lactosutens DS20]|uniref:Uncharacterized protein n=1 Tax=Sphingobium lactosutens DS20 TaxID=1331060 RepID=T0J9N9_9SPHN|nr:hypothetical protein RLDS_01795 [Sphingobium lactosutens DS20]
MIQPACLGQLFAQLDGGLDILGLLDPRPDFNACSFDRGDIL